jgi:hypothetical protein
MLKISKPRRRKNESVQNESKVNQAWTFLKKKVATAFFAWTPQGQQSAQTPHCRDEFPE